MCFPFQNTFIVIIVNIEKLRIWFAHSKRSIIRRLRNLFYSPFLFLLKSLFFSMYTTNYFIDYVKKKARINRKIESVFSVTCSMRTISVLNFAISNQLNVSDGLSLRLSLLTYKTNFGDFSPWEHSIDYEIRTNSYRNRLNSCKLVVFALNVVWFLSNEESLSNKDF